MRFKKLVTCILFALLPVAAHSFLSCASLERGSKADKVELGTLDPRLLHEIDFWRAGVHYTATVELIYRLRRDNERSESAEYVQRVLETSSPMVGCLVLSIKICDSDFDRLHQEVANLEMFEPTIPAGPNSGEPTEQLAALAWNPRDEFLAIVRATTIGGVAFLSAYEGKVVFADAKCAWAAPKHHLFSKNLSEMPHAGIQGPVVKLDAEYRDQDLLVVASRTAAQNVQKLEYIRETRRLWLNGMECR